MRPTTILRHSLLFHWRMNLAVMLGAAVGTASLTGALLVGDSMRGSLEEVALNRLGRVDVAMTSSRFVREELVFDITASALFADQFATACPIIMLSGAALHADSGVRANQVSIIGVSDCFRGLAAGDHSWNVPTPMGRSVILNEPLAAELGARAGEDVLIRMGKPDAMSAETLLGRRDDTTASLRLTVSAIIPGEDLGAFSLRPRQSAPLNLYVPLDTLQRAIDRRGRVNTILVAARSDAPAESEVRPERLRQLLRTHVTLADLGLRLRADEPRGYLSLESEAGLVEPHVEKVGLTIAAASGRPAAAVLTYLANRISIDRSGASSPVERGEGVSVQPASAIPYSTVSAVDPDFAMWSSMTVAAGSGPGSLRPGEIILNQWAADDLQAQPGDRLHLSYYHVGPFGGLETREATFTLRGVVALEGVAADPGFAPEYPGVTDAANLRDWNPPFPVDFSVIRDRDEAYWRTYRTTPKAFITLADGQELWATERDRFGRATSVRIASAPRESAADMSGPVQQSLLAAVDLGQAGLSLEPVRAQLRDAAYGTTDFGGLFIGLSFFLIASAAMLVALLFRLGVERRAAEVGLLLATGFSPQAVRGLLIGEGAVVAGAGGILGLFGSWGYAWFMLTGLRSWWSAAAHVPFLRLHVSATGMIVGLVTGFLIALVSIAWSLHGLTRRAPRALLAGSVAAGRTPRSGRSRGVSLYVAAGTFIVVVASALLPAASDALSQTVAFFVSGSAMLAACLGLIHHRLRTVQPAVVARGGVWATARLGVRNARRRPGRSLLTAALIACATFLISAMQAFHLDVTADVQDRRSGTGGFAFTAESFIPLPYDLNTADGRRSLNVSASADAVLSGVTFMPFRLRPGDESSCLTLYRPTKPRMLGATEAMIRRGGFRFASTLAESQAERDNPWLLLHREFDDGAIPVIGDEGTVKWQLHRALGEDFIDTDDRGQDIRLRFVALLAGSALQSELIVSEANFKPMFPSIAGHAFFLIDTAGAGAPVTVIDAAMERELSAFSFDVGSTAGRLAQYVAVQNTYLATFRMLGGFGLVLGTVGLAAVMLRNVWERRGELALLRALGFSRVVLAWLVLAENTALLATGLAAGFASAMLAIAPHIAARPEAVPWASTIVTLTAVLVTGIVTGVVAVVPTLRAPLLPALRTE